MYSWKYDEIFNYNNPELFLNPYLDLRYVINGICKYVIMENMFIAIKTIYFKMWMMELLCK
jgi:hypothetical protein